jgi:phage FluMu protein Com
MLIWLQAVVVWGITRLCEALATFPAPQHVSRGRYVVKRGRLLRCGFMNPLHATIEVFAAEGYTHVECYCPRCRKTRFFRSFLHSIGCGKCHSANSRSVL